MKILSPGLIYYWLCGVINFSLTEDKTECRETHKQAETDGGCSEEHLKGRNEAFGDFHEQDDRKLRARVFIQELETAKTSVTLQSHLNCDFTRINVREWMNGWIEVTAENSHETVLCFVF